MALAAVPVLAAGGFTPPTSSPLTDAGAIGNLGGPLEPAQVAGIWPVGDFRSHPQPVALAYVAIGVVGLAAAAGLLVAWRRGAWWALAFIAGTLLAALAIGLAGSPWVDGKALATASAAVPFAALVVAFAAWGRGRAVVGAGLALLVFGGVAWSNILAYRDVGLAPRERLAELERIGDLVGGDGPTLMTEYNPYGARHFLREGEAEGVSELRRREIDLADGGPVRKGLSADTDELDPSDLLVYRSLVLRRSPVRSRPPSPYRLAWRGRFYELWQRPKDAPPVDRLALGSELDAGGVPDCRHVVALAKSARSGELLVAEAPRPLVFTLPEALEGVQRRGPARYRAWLRGSVRGSADLYAGSEQVAEARHELNHEGGYIDFGEVELGAGEHELRLELGGADLHPGSGGALADVGPLILVPEGEPPPRVALVPASEARELCGRRWDWIESGATQP